MARFLQFRHESMFSLSLDCSNQGSNCPDKYSGDIDSTTRQQMNGSTVSIQDYIEDYDSIRMIHEPSQNHSFNALSNSSLLQHTAYNSATAGYQNNEEMPSVTNTSILPTFPSYFVSREGKKYGHSNQKHARSNSVGIHAASLTDTVHVQSDEEIRLSTIFQHQA